MGPEPQPQQLALQAPPPGSLPRPSIPGPAPRKPHVPSLVEDPLQSPGAAPKPLPAPFLHPEPVLANDVASCNSPATPSGTSTSTQALGTGAAEDIRGNDGSGSGSRIVNGSDCPPHGEPWQAALMLRHNQLYCGAVLVAPQWLLTAAHCHKQ